MTTMTTTRPHVSGDDRMRAAEHHLLAMPTAGPDDEARERDRARHLVQRVAGQDAADLLDILGLAIPETAPDEPAPPVTERKCARCKEVQPRAEFVRHGSDGETLYSQCVTCRRIRRNKAQRALYAQRGGGGMPGGDENISWRVTAPGGRGMKCSAAAVEARVESWRELRVDEKRSARTAAERMRISMRSARRYDRTLKDRGLLAETLASGRAVA